MRAFTFANIYSASLQETTWEGPGCHSAHLSALQGAAVVFSIALPTPEVESRRLFGDRSPVDVAIAGSIQFCIVIESYSK